MQTRIRRQSFFVLALATLALVGTTSAQDYHDTDPLPTPSALPQTSAEENNDRPVAARLALRPTRTTENRASAAETLRAARRIYILPNQHVDKKYLEYKLAKQPEFAVWGLAITQNERNADLVIEVHRRAFNYIFSLVEPRSGTVLVNGKVMAINGLVAAEELGREVIRRMKELRALPTAAP